MLYCPKCQQLEATTPQKHDDGTVTYLCKKCGGAIPLRRDLHPGEVVAGFEIEEELGRGAMGIVYQARQTNLDREVAIKILSDDSASDEVYVERFFREARAAASLSHPNVVQAYDAGVTSDGIYYFVMEKVTGENLELVLNNVGPLNIPQAVDVFISVANALSYAWTRNQLSHGDIKPENIIMRLNGKVKLADFGLARRAKDPELADEDIRATPAYAPPEIINGVPDVPGFKSDMYSFGATAYHILIGHEPFVGTDPTKVCAMQLSEIQTPLSELNPNIPRRLSDLVDHLMEKAPENRPESWSDVVDELKAIRDELGAGGAAGQSKSEGKTPRDRSGVSRKTGLRSYIPVAVAAAVLLLVAVCVAVFFVLRSGKTDAGKIPVNNRPASNSGGDAPKTAAKKPDPVRDGAYYQAEWQTLRDGADPDLKTVEAFVTEAGALAPAEAVELLRTLRERQAKADAEAAQTRALVLRNELLDLADSFDPAEAGKLNADQLDALFVAARSKLAELNRLDAALPESLFLPEHRKKVESYLKRLGDLQVSKSLGGFTPDGSGTPDESVPQAPAEPTEADPIPETDANPPDPDEEVAETDNVSPRLAVYLDLLEKLPKAIDSEQERANALRTLNDLLADASFTDAEVRQNCADIRNFLVLSQQPFLPYLANSENVLRGMKLFPNTYPDSVLDDIEDTSFRLKESNGKASMKVPWNAIRRGEGEPQIVVTLINSPQLAKLPADFREYLYVRALFFGIDPERLAKRYDRASGLPAKKREELKRIAGFFQSPDEDYIEIED